MNLMFARLEEFESLTPLIITPCSTVTPENQTVSNYSTRQFLASKTSVSCLEMRPFSGRNKKEEASPPPPRRSVAGKTMIVPLTGNNNHRIGLL